MVKRVDLTKEEFLLYDSFIQYGDFNKAKIEFVGREEGLDGQGIWENYKGRKKWFGAIPEHIHYLQDQDANSGFFIDDSLIAGWIREGKASSLDEHFILSKNRKKSPVLDQESRILFMLEEGFDFIKDDNKDIPKDMVDDYYYNKLFRLDSETAMFDYYALPMQGDNIFTVEGKKVKDITENRKNIIRKLYDTFDFPLSFVYSGIQDHQFRARNFYEELGFDLKERDTSIVNDNYKNIVKPSSKPKPFLFGKRENKNQYAILTPFIGSPGSVNCTREDCIVATTWIKDIYK